MVPLTATALRVRALTDIDGLAQLDAAWDMLVEAMPRPSPYLFSAWVRAWFAEPAFASEPHVVVAERAGELVGFAPFAVRQAGRDPTRQRAQLTYRGGVVERVRVAHEVANVVKGHAAGPAGVGQRPRAVRGDLDLVALTHARHERGREGLRTARLGERDDHEQPGRQWRGGSVSMASHCGREPH